MINYYKSGISFYKVDTDSKYFYHVNDSENMSFISLVTNEMAFDKLSKVITDNIESQWVSISEEDFTFVKQKVLNKLK
jgi:hypothetical protein